LSDLSQCCKRLRACRSWPCSYKLNKPSSLASKNSRARATRSCLSGNTVTEFNHTGTVLSGTGYTGSLNTPSSIAVDANDVVWVTSSGNNTVSRLNGSSGAAIGSPASGGGLNQPRSISFDSLGNAWIANTGNASVTVINSAAATLTNYTPAAATSPLAIGVNPH
jgi:streptogramin lyase